MSDDRSSNVAMEVTEANFAVARYRQALETDERNAAAQIGLARALIEAGRFDEAERWIENLPAAMAADEAVERLSAGLALRRICAEHGGLDECRRRAEADPE